MVSLWPWRGDSSSTASFEKTLSTLSTKIKDTQTRLDRVRSSSRRSKVLSTLYLAFGYLVYAIVLLLVVGYKNVGAYEWTGLAGGPVIIYGVRRMLAAYFTFRIEGLEARLKEYQEERSKTIQKLKDATKYDSTMELIEKYGGVEGKAAQDMKKGGPGEAAPIPGVSGGKKAEGDRKGNSPSRTTMPPPPTANIQHRPVSPNQQDQSGSMEPTAEFAPNAEHLPLQSPSPFQAYPQQPYPSFQQPESHWYDRIFDVLLGEDETAPKNRIVLLCAHCRLVNGQAPPGIKSLSELGRWRCMGCNGENGEVEDERTRVIREALDAEAPVSEAPSKAHGQAPKRPLSAYMYFATKHRDSVREENPSITFGAVGKVLGERWKALDEKQREPYEAMAAADMARYEDEKRAYNAMADIEEEKSSQDEDSNSRATVNEPDGPAASVKKRRGGRK